MIAGSTISRVSGPQNQAFASDREVGLLGRIWFARPRGSCNSANAQPAMAEQNVCSVAFRRRPALIFQGVTQVKTQASIDVMLHLIWKPGADTEDFRFAKEMHLRRVEWKSHAGTDAELDFGCASASGR